MKRALYTIADEEFATLLEKTSSAFESTGLGYAFVGGVATQAHIANYLCRGGRFLLDFVKDPDFRLQDFLRATDDVDITLGPRKVGKLLTEDEKLQHSKIVSSSLTKIPGVFLSPSEEHLVSIQQKRSGVVRPSFMLGLDDEPKGDKTVSFNLYKGPEDSKDRWGADIAEFESRFYDEFMGRGVTLSIPFSLTGRKVLNLRVKRVEDLVATKIIRGRAKDFSDLVSLARQSNKAGMPINYGEVSAILSEKDPRLDIPNPNFVEKFEAFMDVKDSYTEE